MAVAPLLPPVSQVFVTICKKAYQPLLNDNDQLLISNWGALRIGLDALNKEDSSDWVRADELWAKAKALLITEEENIVGASAQGSIQMDDAFDMECVPYGL
jgi:hypothetical protein